jgi:hypothetical protein
MYDRNSSMSMTAEAVLPPQATKSYSHITTLDFGNAVIARIPYLASVVAAYGHLTHLRGWIHVDYSIQDLVTILHPLKDNLLRLDA